jgi:hypothetical protein
VSTLLEAGVEQSIDRLVALIGLERRTRRRRRSESECERKECVHLNKKQLNRSRRDPTLLEAILFYLSLSLSSLYSCATIDRREEK